LVPAPFSPHPSLSLSPFFFSSLLPPPSLPSFPTRRSSDLGPCSNRDSVRHDHRFRHQFMDYSADTHNCCHNGCCIDTGHTVQTGDRKSTRLNSSHVSTSYAVFCLKKKKKENENERKRHGTI